MKIPPISFVLILFLCCGLLASCGSVKHAEMLMLRDVQNRIAAIDTYMPEAIATRPNGGFFISMTLPQGTSTTDLRLAAAKRNLNLADGLAFFPQGGGERFLRLPFCALTPAQIEEGVKRVAETVREVRK